jgi:ankyrin repeat protein
MSFAEAIIQNKPDLLRQILSGGYHPDTRVCGIPAIAHAALANRIALVRVLLDFHAHPNPTVGQEPLILLVIRSCDLEVARLLLRSGADANAPDVNGYTPLMMLVDAAEEVTSRIELLIEYGCDLDRVDRRGRSALHHAVECVHYVHGSEEVIQILLENYADPDLQDHEGETPLHRLAYPNRRVVQLFIDAFADFSLEDRRGVTVERYLSGQE